MAQSPHCLLNCVPDLAAVPGADAAHHGVDDEVGHVLAEPPHHKVVKRLVIYRVRMQD